MSFETAKGKEPKTFRKVDLSNTAVDIDSTIKPWGLVKVIAHSANAADVFLHLYNAAAANVTVGTTTPKLTLPIPAGGGVIDDYAAHVPFFSTNISIAVTTTYAGAVAPGSACLAEVIYV